MIITRTYTAVQWHNNRGFEGYSNPLVTIPTPENEPWLRHYCWYHIINDYTHTPQSTLEESKFKKENTRINQKPVKCYGV